MATTEKTRPATAPDNGESTIDSLPPPVLDSIQPTAVAAKANATEPPALPLDLVETPDNPDDDDDDGDGDASFEQEEQEESDLGMPPSPPTMDDFVEPVAQAPVSNHHAVVSRMSAPRVQQQQQHHQIPLQYVPQPMYPHAMMAPRQMNQPLAYPSLAQLYHNNNDTHSAASSRSSGRSGSRLGMRAPPSRRRHRRSSAHKQRNPRVHNPRQTQVVQQRNRLVRPTVPELSSAATSEVESDTSSVFSSASSAAASRNRPRRALLRSKADTVVSEDVYDARDRARDKGGVVGLLENLSEFDFVCPHCVQIDANRRQLATVTFSCCSRRAHYKCMARIPNVHHLALIGVPACIQCLRPSDLPSFQAQLEFHHDDLQSERAPEGPALKTDDDDDDEKQGPLTGVERAWNTYTALGSYLKQKGMIKGVGAFLRSQDRTKPPQMDWDQAIHSGVDAQTLFKAGWSLQTIANELRLGRLDDSDWKDKLRFDRHTVLESRCTDMLYLMRHFELHPYELRAHFHIKLRDLWNTAERRRKSSRGEASRGSSGSNSQNSQSGSQSPTADARSSQENQQALEEALQARAQEKGLVDGGAAAAAARGYEQTTEDLCEKQGVLSPRKLAILGFDLHHMLVMGFNKDHFVNFSCFTMDDWLTHLGFRKPHWGILRLSKDDFAQPSGVVANLPGWRLDTLMERWATTPTELYEMGVLDPKQIQQLLHPSIPIVMPIHRVPQHQSRPHQYPLPPSYQHYQQQQRYHYARQQQQHPQMARSLRAGPGYAPHPRRQPHRVVHSTQRPSTRPVTRIAVRPGTRVPSRGSPRGRTAHPRARGKNQRVVPRNARQKKLGNEYGI